ncbi:MAG: hypothetical protein A3F69_01770 [Acidobacteria bacterium RIFCSPLOWO2_12_FULL_66_10]|nr:MAG: hypothetical protein A3F69_01770 [Acidobacteria bacterium RIFCSPLOWO2_12_FULL_66_10]
MNVTSGTYLPLHAYLERRYADTIVLTFAQMEDLLGFALPEMARLRREWWTPPDADSAQPGASPSWTRAGRTAAPNLSAAIVVFDRA